MLFGTPVLKEHLKLDPLYLNAQNPVTDLDVAEAAILQRGATQLEVVRRGNAMLKESGESDHTVLIRLFNASTHRLWLKDLSAKAGKVWKYPPDYYIDNGQWSMFVVTDGGHNYDLTLRYGFDQGLVPWFYEVGLQAMEATAAVSKDKVRVGKQGGYIREEKDGFAVAAIRATAGKCQILDCVFRHQKSY